MTDLRNLQICEAAIDNIQKELITQSEEPHYKYQTENAADFGSLSTTHSVFEMPTGFHLDITISADNSR